MPRAREREWCYAARVAPCALEHNREILVLAYLREPSPALLAEIVRAFDPICRERSKAWLSNARRPGDSLEDLRQEARVRMIQLLPTYEPRIVGSFQRLLLCELGWLFANAKRKNLREASAMELLRGETPLDSQWSYFEEKPRMIRKRLSVSLRALLERMIEIGHSTLPRDHAPTRNLWAAGLVRRAQQTQGSVAMWEPTQLGREWVADMARGVAARTAPQNAKRLRARAVRARRAIP